MVSFYSENDFSLKDEKEVNDWIQTVIASEGCEEGEITFVFCGDEFLLRLNQEYLDHDTYTDIISFDYSLGKELHGEIYISTDRVSENANDFKVSFTDELHRVIIHGILHLCGYKDKSEKEKELMRSKENAALASRNFV
ncbi:MAG: rRNA maturation RNase YbeY [Flavobacterium sp.]|nr:MAG: rRNA maturation RNase YbeY [Flavobacterium sp.]